MGNGTKAFFTPDARSCGGLSVASGRRARPHDLIALIEENDPGLSDDVRDEEELMRDPLLELPGSAWSPRHRQLEWAIEEFRKRKLDARDAQLRVWCRSNTTP
jgi:hypothetical protein